MKYYSSGGKWNKQYVVADLDDFANKNLHHAVGPTGFKLRLSRTEVVKLPSWTDEPIFPTEAKFREANYTIEGIEKKGEPSIPDTVDLVEEYSAKAPTFTEADLKRFSEIYDADAEENYKFSKSQKKLQTHPDGTWKNQPKTKDKRPDYIPDDIEWEELDDVEKAMLRSQLSDLGETAKETGIDGSDPALIDADSLLDDDTYELNWCGLRGDAQLDPNGEEFEPEIAHKNHWIETTGYWIYWKAKAKKGIVHPNSHIIGRANATVTGAKGPGSPTELEGERITRPLFLGESAPKIIYDSFLRG